MYSPQSIIREHEIALAGVVSVERQTGFDWIRIRLPMGQNQFCFSSGCTPRTQNVYHMSEAEVLVLGVCGIWIEGRIDMGITVQHNQQRELNGLMEPEPQYFFQVLRK